MYEISYTWDESKNKSNQRKHGITFEEAKLVFSDKHGLVIHDLDHSDEEDRFVILGLSEQNRLLVVVHSYLEDNHLIRIISSRKATKHEWNDYVRRQNK
jgi:hypothetical protein